MSLCSPALSGPGRSGVDVALAIAGTKPRPRTCVVKGNPQYSTKPTDKAEAWSSDLLKRCRLQTGAEDAAALLQQDSQNLETLASALQATWMQHGAERVVRAPAAASDAGEVLGQLGPGAHVALATDFYSAVVALPGTTTPACCLGGEIQCVRGAQSKKATLGSSCMLKEAAFATQQIVVQVHDAVDEAGPLPSPSCPLLILVCGENAAQAHVSTQLMQHRVEASQPPAHEFADKVVQLISAGDAAGPSVHVGPHCGCGKTFSVRMSAKEQGASYRQLKLTAALGFGALGRARVRSKELIVLGRVARMGADRADGIFKLDSRCLGCLRLVFAQQKNAPAPGDRDRALALWAAAQRRAETEMKTGEKEAEGEKAAKRAVTGACVFLRLAPACQQHREGKGGRGPSRADAQSSQAEAFCADEASLQAGLGDSFAAARHDGLRNPDAVATAYHRLQYVCGALVAWLGVVPGSEVCLEFSTKMGIKKALKAIVRRLGGAFPLQYEGADGELGGEECFSLLVEFAKLKLRPSLWNIWSFVDVLYWQLKEEGAPQAKPMSELLAQDCPMFKGELIAFILRTARDFATRQTANNEVDPETVVAAHLQNFHQDRFCGTWRLQPFSSDGHPVFAKYDKSEKGSGQFFLYYRAAQRMWVIDAELDKVAPAFAYTRKRDYDKGWWRMASWVPNKGMTVVKAEHPLAFEKDAVEVRGVDEQLTGSPEEYLVPLNGMYLRQPKDENVNGYQHYVLEKPRRHLFWDKGASLCGPYVTMGRDEQVPNARVSFVTAGQEAAAAVRREPQQDEDFPLLRWEDSSGTAEHARANSKHQVCFLSSQPTKRLVLDTVLLRAFGRFVEEDCVSVGESLDALTADHTKILGCLTGVDRSREEAAQLLDGKYCLTGDAVLKMLAIFVRLRCGLPVCLSSTGDEATRKRCPGEPFAGMFKQTLQSPVDAFIWIQVRYLCAWLGVELVTLNVHGGTTEDDIDRAFAQARKLVQEREGERVIIFLDEINTSQHVNMLCEAARRPQQQLTTGLVFGGQGSAEEEMSGLVYRVHAVPETVNDFLFDFGAALTQKAEKMYVRSMVQNGWPESHEREQELVTELLCLAQAFIRWEEGDPSAVSLRDVLEALLASRPVDPGALWKEDCEESPTPSLGGDLAKLVCVRVVAVALVYHYRLASRDSRHSLWIDLTRRAPWPGDRGEMKGRGWAELSKQREAMENILRKVQNNVAKEFEVEKDVVMNEALAENVFVGLLCIMNRIPLFIVGKPGHRFDQWFSIRRGKPHLKDSVYAGLVACPFQLITGEAGGVRMSNLQGKLSKSKFLQTLPALRLMQYQCSPLSTADGIQRQFDAASRFASNALDAQVVLLLDEVGLAEFSPAKDMPLKVLHGILAEPGIVSVVGHEAAKAQETVAAEKTLAVKSRHAIAKSATDDQKLSLVPTGLSNWRLDPAKMNRSVCLARPDPDSAEVGRTGAGLLAAFSGSSSPDWLKELSAAFWSVFADQGDRDWLGMRDYYSFVRAVRDGCLSASVEQPTAEILAFAIRRNFGGTKTPVMGLFGFAFEPSATLRCAHQAAGILPKDAEILLGSDFPEDASEAYAIRQLMRVRDAMAKGRMLLLCGMDVIYEALYDVLNQRYVRRRTEEGEIELLLRLAIGARSQLCSMAPSFKLLVLVDQDQAFRQLDVPFLNRFEKQLAEPTELLDPARQPLLAKLQAWAEVLALEAGCDVVAGGLTPSTLASLLLARPEADLQQLKLAILDMALPLAVFRSKSLQQLREENSYFQVRRSLASSMVHIVSGVNSGGILCELSTSSPMAHMPPLQDLAEVGGHSIIPISQLSGSQQLEDILEKFFSEGAGTSENRTLVLQVDALSCSTSRLALTRHRCKGYSWQPQIGWHSMFVDDLQGGAGRGTEFRDRGRYGDGRPLSGPHIAALRRSAPGHLRFCFLSPVPCGISPRWSLTGAPEVSRAASNAGYFRAWPDAQVPAAEATDAGGDQMMEDLGVGKVTFAARRRFALTHMLDVQARSQAGSVSEEDPFASGATGLLKDPKVTHAISVASAAVQAEAKRLQNESWKRWRHRFWTSSASAVTAATMTGEWEKLWTKVHLAHYKAWNEFAVDVMLLVMFVSLFVIVGEALGHLLRFRHIPQRYAPLGLWLILQCSTTGWFMVLWASLATFRVSRLITSGRLGFVELIARLWFHSVFDDYRPEGALQTASSHLSEQAVAETTL
ncbi:RNF213 [Symbiodinium microadriaticum]|nr:RNF213 [Symbiodinium microadriaticum]